MRLALLIVDIPNASQRIVARNTTEARRMIYTAPAVIDTLEIVLSDGLPTLGADFPRGLREAVLTLQKLRPLHMRQLPQVDATAVATKAFPMELDARKFEHVAAADVILDRAAAAGAYRVICLEACFAQKVSSLLIVFIPLGVVSCVCQIGGASPAVEALRVVGAPRLGFAGLIVDV